mmetsp:Transcript_6913/g.10878  ORF Transcript_6913/g.10878 Transcript_6913/m.10878 type:complete len:125 (-) Transcript_6913:563-937(-)
MPTRSPGAGGSGHHQGRAGTVQQQPRVQLGSCSERELGVDDLDVCRLANGVGVRLCFRQRMLSSIVTVTVTITSPNTDTNSNTDTNTLTDTSSQYTIAFEPEPNSSILYSKPKSSPPCHERFSF